jgi:prevent-host-death family protein
MKTTTVRELRNNYAKVLKWVSTGQEVQVTRRGKVVAKVVPPDEPALRVDWAQSAARQITGADKALTARQSDRLLKEAQGNW